MDRKDEIIRLQMDVISQMTRNNLTRIADDLWGSPAAPSVPQAQETAEEQPKEAAKEEEKPESIEDLKKELEGYIGLETVKKEVAERDYNDMNRKHSPLRKAEDAVLIMSDGMTIDEVCDKIMEIAGK